MFAKGQISCHVNIMASKGDIIEVKNMILTRYVTFMSWSQKEAKLHNADEVELNTNMNFIKACPEQFFFPLTKFFTKVTRS